MFNKRTLIGSSVIPMRFAFFMWLIFTLEFVYGLDIKMFGLVPRDAMGAIGIITSPFFHADPIHLISNTIPFLFLGITLFYNYPIISQKVFYGCYFLTNLLVWLFARPEPHIGASGLVYALATFIIFYGLFRKQLKALLISAVVVILYGSIYYGILPTDGRVSWESHLFGSLIGLILALFYGRKNSV